MTGRQLAQQRDLRGAPLGVAEPLPQPAAGVEVAPRRRVHRRRDVAAQDDPPPVALDLRVRDRHGRQQGHRVRMERLAVELARRRQLHDPPEVHHGDPVADVADHRQVVGDEQVGEIEPVLELLEQVDDLRLDRDVEGRDRLVGDDQVGLQRERPGDADPLALPAGELVRIAVRVVRVEPDGRDAAPGPARDGRPSRRPRGSRAARRRSPPAVIRGLRLAYGSWKIICIRRRAATHLLPVERGQVDAVDQHATRRRLEQPDDGPSRRRLAAPGLADEPERLAAAHARTRPRPRPARRRRGAGR